MRALTDVAADLGLAPDDLLPWGPGAAKIRPEAAFSEAAPSGKLILVSAMTPTPAGEGKTTTAIGLAQGARHLGIRTAVALREPSLGPVLGQKGGGTGGGKSILVPSDRINLHFTGDLHAIAAANNLLAAMVDQSLHTGGPLDSRRVTFRRALDLCDRSLRNVMVGLGDYDDGVPRETGFDITAASEVMAVLCLASDWTDLKKRLGDIVVGGGAGGPVRARDLVADGAMAALLRDALLPNLVQTYDGTPALVHGGPFANIAHGCNSIVATRLALRSADLVFTEAGFAFDLGGEKFLDIKCRAAGLWPRAVALVVTLRAIRWHGGAVDFAKADAAALERGLDNVRQHVAAIRSYGLPAVVVVNTRAGDDPAELRGLVAKLAEEGIEAGVADVYGQGGAGAAEVVERLAAHAETEKAPKRPYELTDSPRAKLEQLVRRVYGGRDVVITANAEKGLQRAARLGLANAPICVAKTHLSLSDDPTKRNRPKDFDVTVREVRVSAGAGFVVALTGEIRTMPGLGKEAAAADIDLLPDGTIVGVE